VVLVVWGWSHFRTAGPPIGSNILLSSQARDRTSLLPFDHAGTQSREAYDLYVKGRYYWREKSHGGLFKSIAYFRRAIEKDPNFALAWAGLARSYAGDLENLHNVDAAAQKAIALDGKLAEPHSTLGFIRIFRDHNWPDAQRELKLAIELNPGSAMAHQYYSAYLVTHGRLDEAEKEIRRARDLDPELLSTTTDLAQVLYFKRDYEGAIEECKKVLRRDSRFFDAHNVLYHAYTLSGKYNDAFDEYLQLIDLLAYQPPADLDEVKRIYATKGVYGFWKEQIALFRYWGIGEDSKAYEIAEANALLAFDKREFIDRALTYLSKACDKPINYTLVYVKVNPIFDSVRSDPRFAKVLERLHLN
jgi:tetratricopeptide (TPR) repeat protein